MNGQINNFGLLNKAGNARGPSCNQSEVRILDGQFMSNKKVSR